MSTRVNKKQILTDEQRLAKEAVMKEKKRVYAQKYRAAKKAAKAPKAKNAKAPKAKKAAVKAPKAKKAKICASFPQHFVKLNNEAKRLKRIDREDLITNEMKNAVSIISKLYDEHRNASAKKRSPQKASPKKKEQEDENSVWLKKKSVLRLSTLGAETMELNKQGEKLRKLALKGELVNITNEMKNAMSIVRKFNRTQDKYRPVKKTTAITVAAPPVISMRTALDELSRQYASDDEDEAEDEAEDEDEAEAEHDVYNSIWNPFMNLTI